ncbi:hypothetical protein PPYR_01533 [Photinus pyralis]|uniref:FLYWCH-type domain-containing protein n=2 Tax=Photinus pyralis TaxID=7054 RepID=A0A5N4B4U0_PHOPY|nr:uncharacterized protein LOC116166282 [Photinus pyralis]KAB0801401.1 hypothetical protein PPYR_05755 [Photinus pyralis]KAB0804563.1 hypothetical protein PPYR_01533 [Photinus pyralis]
MALEFVSSEKGKSKLFFESFLFIKDKQVDTKIYWKCEHSKKMKCKARVITVNNFVSSSNNDHNHNADAAQLEANKVMQKIKEDAENTRDTPQFIVSQASAGLGNAVAAKLPTVNNIKRTIRNVRVRENVAPAIPRHREEIIFPEEFTITTNGELFLLHDSGPVNDRILIFSTARNINLLAMSQHWYADGTFKVVPPLFLQLYTIHGIKDHVAIPLIYALLPNKTEQTYLNLLREIKNLLPADDAQPQTIMTDFEVAMINAIRIEFPQTIHRGCFFHLCQSIFRHIQENGLKREYERNPEVALTLKLLPALAFVPPQDVIPAFEDICEQNIFSPELQVIVDYFEDTWIGRPQRRGRRPPHFAINMWNCFDAVQHGLPKTNNAVEGWHRAFQMQLCADHPNIWKFISALKREQSINELRIEQHISGQPPTISRKEYRDCAQRLLTLVNSYAPDINIYDYVRGIAHNISY